MLPWALWAFLAVLNIFSIALFGIDKIKAIRGGRRIPEVTLLLVSFFGPFGAYAAMLILRHKTRKPKFLLVPIFVFIQVGLLAYLIR